MDGYSDDPRDPGTSIAAPLIRALLAAAIAFGLYWLVFAQDDPAQDVAVLATPTQEVTAAATVPPDPSTATSPPVLEPTPVPTFTESSGQVGQGVTVQLLNGTDDQAAFDDVAATLRDLGYDVTLGPRARNDYAETTIFATAGQEADASALQAADPRFTTIGENPGNLDTAIDIHVVVGEDWEAGGAPDGGSPTESDTEGV